MQENTLQLIKKIAIILIIIEIMLKAWGLIGSILFVNSFSNTYSLESLLNLNASLFIDTTVFIVLYALFLFLIIKKNNWGYLGTMLITLWPIYFQIQKIFTYTQTELLILTGLFLVLNIILIIISAILFIKLKK